MANHNAKVEAKIPKLAITLEANLWILASNLALKMSDWDCGTDTELGVDILQLPGNQGIIEAASSSNINKEDEFGQ